nr:MAG TPA: Endolysin [Caudoviricetes sp.]
MTFNEFKNEVLGKSLDYDGVAGYQCVDLAKVYLDWMFGIKPGAWGNAKDYWNNLNRPGMSDYFYRVPNTADLVVERGDIVVWGAMPGNPYGHIAIGLGEGDLNGFQSLDQNWGTSYVKQVGHSFNNVLGVLRLKDPSILDYIPTPTKEYDSNEELHYRVHVSDKGWLPWVKGGEVAGTTGEERRIEAIQIDAQFACTVKAHIEKRGWIDYGEIRPETIIGTVGESLRLEALVIEPIGNKFPLTGKVHIQNRGWENWYNLDGVISLGTTGLGLRMEAIQLWYEKL